MIQHKTMCVSSEKTLQTLPGVCALINRSQHCKCPTGSGIGFQKVGYFADKRRQGFRSAIALTRRHQKGFCFSGLTIEVITGTGVFMKIFKPKGTVGTKCADEDMPHEASRHQRRSAGNTGFKPLGFQDNKSTGDKSRRSDSFANGGFYHPVEHSKKFTLESFFIGRHCQLLRVAP